MTTYAQLLTDFPAWVKRIDLSASIPGYVALFESRANRRLRTRRQETSFSGTIDASNKIALPSDFVAFKALWVTGYEGVPIRPQSLESVVARDRTSGAPTLYALDGLNVRFDGSGDVVGVYYAAVPGLVANATNWLSVAAYDSYLFGALLEGAMFSLDQQRASLYLARSDAALQEVIDTDMRDRFNGPLQARNR